MRLALTLPLLLAVLAAAPATAQQANPHTKAQAKPQQTRPAQPAQPGPQSPSGQANPSAQQSPFSQLPASGKPSEAEEVMRQRILLREKFNKGWNVRDEDPRARKARCKSEARKHYTAMHPLKRRKFRKDCLAGKVSSLIQLRESDSSPIFSLGHDPFRKSLHAFRDHALAAPVTT